MRCEHLRFVLLFFLMFLEDFFNVGSMICIVVRYMLRLLTGRRLPANLSYFEEMIGHFPLHFFLGGQAVVSRNVASSNPPGCIA